MKSTIAIAALLISSSAFAQAPTLQSTTQKTTQLGSATAAAQKAAEDSNTLEADLAKKALAAAKASPPGALALWTALAAEAKTAHDSATKATKAAQLAESNTADFETWVAAAVKAQQPPPPPDCSPNAITTRTGPSTYACTCKAGYKGDGKVCVEVKK
jgi:hypothetical protein